MEVLFIWLNGSLYTRYDRAHITRPRVRHTAISCPSIRELKVTLILFPTVTTLSVKVTSLSPIHRKAMITAAIITTLSGGRAVVERAEEMDPIPNAKTLDATKLRAVKATFPMDTGYNIDDTAPITNSMTNVYRSATASAFITEKNALSLLRPISM